MYKNKEVPFELQLLCLGKHRIVYTKKFLKKVWKTEALRARLCDLVENAMNSLYFATTSPKGHKLCVDFPLVSCVVVIISCILYYSNDSTVLR